MAIKATCPHCRTQTLVHEKFAGVSGPCRYCHQPMSIPSAGLNPTVGGCLILFILTLVFHFVAARLLSRDNFRWFFFIYWIGFGLFLAMKAIGKASHKRDTSETARDRREMIMNQIAKTNAQKDETSQGPSPIIDQAKPLSDNESKKEDDPLAQ